MKKVLFATSALVATAGMSAADVNVGGSARIGLVYDNNSTLAQTVKVEKRISINLDGSGSTDGGLEFGGRIRLRSNENDSMGDVSSGNVYVGNDTWRVTVGNTSGALVTRLGYLQGSIGLTGLQWENVSFNIGSNTFALNTYSSSGNAGGDVVRLDFNVGGLGISLSTDSTGDHLNNGSEDALAVGYNFGDWNVAAGYGKDVAGSGADIWSVSAAGSIGEFGVGLQYSDMTGVGNKAVLNGSYDFGDTTVVAFIARTQVDVAGAFDFPAGSTSETGYGLGFTHSLGGATLAGGVSHNFAGDTMADMGIRFSF